MGDNTKKALVDGLNGLLADHLALYLKTKNFHWHVKGREFRDLHLLFDEQATEIFGNVDIIAERVRKNGADTLTSIGSVAAKTKVADEDDSNLGAMQMVEQLRDDNATLVKSLKAVKELAGEAGDNATDGLIDDWTDQAEERVWFLSSILA
ncbi:Dps family protein [Croceicoccus naphthovorans]|uniref:DNA-binding protein n=1 Tax=Croceicoccus naphthovorans TaxID=1348774 RepID=A0A0G3XJW6_9SPHN|nr:DNA starvation/stationary phase protection protein [Croceicoccus naphthovorans]AKM10658.1 DNA-binding protein [Croceicoccus naphthovorans]MBB3988892.1 starvation-inducible DNA-binding protein [Croceicoccus naphthovorans]